MKYAKLSNKSWLKKQIADKPLRQIAEEVGCSYSAVVHASRKFGIEVPIRLTHKSHVDKSAIMKVAYRKKYPKGTTGELHNQWKGGVQMFNGYRRIYVPTHPRATTMNPYVFEHILIAEKAIGRPITKAEVVHHLNGDKLDNRPENLQVLTRGQHVHSHYTNGQALQKLHKQISYLQDLLDDNDIKY